MSSSTLTYAHSLNDIARAFGPEPLDKDTFAAYYCGDTMGIRTGDPYSSPIDDLFAECTMPASKNAHLLQGHKGCGKSTELNFLKSRLEEAGHKVVVIACALEIDLPNAAYWDLLILTAKALFSVASDVQCPLDRKILEKILNYWNEQEILREQTDAASTTFEAGVEVATPALLNKILNIFGRVKTEVKFGDETRKIIRERVERKASEWVSDIKYAADAITLHLNGKQPVIIFEDLDKMDPESAWRIFSSYASTLSDMPFPVIYTFPIALTYDCRYPALAGYFKPQILPMIKIRTPEGVEHKPGIDIIRKIIGKRADLKLFDEAALLLMIEKTGGLLRDLFSLIIDAARRAQRRNASRIEKEDAERVILELKSSLTRRIDASYYVVLKNIHTHHKQIEDREKQLEMMQALVVLEYNSERWYALHPLAADYLIELGIIKKR